MRIVHVIPYFPPASRFGGVPEAVFSLTRAQAQLGHDVFVITSDAGLDRETQREGLSLQWKNTSRLRATGEVEGVHILYVPNRRSMMANRCKLFTASYWNEETHARLAPSFDVLHFHEVHIPGYRTIGRQALIRNVKLCVSCHGSLTPPVHRGVKRLLHKIFDPPLRKGWFEKAAAYFALCRNESDQLLRCAVSPNRIHIIPHGQPSFTPPFAGLPFPVSEHTDIPTFLYLGRINRDKGVLDVVKAYCALWQKDYRTRLICCGPDEGCLSEIQKLCARKKTPIACDAVLSQTGVYMLSEIPRQSIPALFALADGTICPSPYEIFGLVPVESLVCGVPILAASSYGCIEHLTAPKEQVEVVEPGDVDGIQDYMFNCPMRNKQNPAPFNSEKILPSWDEIAQRVCAIYRQILRR